MIPFIHEGKSSTDNSIDLIEAPLFGTLLLDAPATSGIVHFAYFSVKLIKIYIIHIFLH